MDGALDAVATLRQRLLQRRDAVERLKKRQNQRIQLALDRDDAGSDSATASGPVGAETTTATAAVATVAATTRTASTTATDGKPDRTALSSQRPGRRVGSFSHVNLRLQSLADTRANGASAASKKPNTTKSSNTERLHEKESVFNDYCQRFVDSGERPQNFIQGRQRLFELKEELIRKRAQPAFYAHVDLRSADLSRLLQSHFDVILIDPPMEEYRRRATLLKAPLGGQVSWTWDEIMNLRIEDIAAPQSFLFLWVGSEEGLEHGRRCLNKWGFRRVEDIVWLKSNKQSQSAPPLGPRAALQHTKEHCLVGLKGVVRRSSDGHIIHANCDVDVIVSEDMGNDSTRKPDELYAVIEHLCMGRRRLELFGDDHNRRPGWITLGLGITSSNFNPTTYLSHFIPTDPMDIYVGTSREIEDLRPQSPPPEQTVGRHFPHANSRGGGQPSSVHPRDRRY